MTNHLDPRTARRNAADGWIYGYALLQNYRTMYAQAVDASDPKYVGGFGRFRHYSRPFAPDNTDVVTPNNDTPYSWAWLDLRAEPWVVSVPAIDRYYVLPFHDLDTSYVGYIGARTTGRQAGHYLLAGPDWLGSTPSGISGVLQAGASLVGTLSRTYLAGPEDCDTLRAIQQQYLLRPLSEFLGQSAPPPAPEPRWPVWKEEVLDSAEFFGYLDFLLGFFPIVPTDSAIRERLAALGVDGRGTFDPARLAPDIREAIEQGIADAHTRLDQAKASTSASTGLFGTRAELGDDYLKRAVGAAMGLYGLPSVEAWYAGWFSDSAGNRPPNAAQRDYTIHFPAGKLPPGRFFWSATMYRLPERLLVANPIDRYSIGDRTPGLGYDADGGLTLHVRRSRPTDPRQAANWLPAPDGPFTVIIRVYGPAEAVLDGNWRIPPLDPAN